jgi:enamidase
VCGYILTAPDGHPVSTIYGGSDMFIDSGVRQIDEPSLVEGIIDSLSVDQVDVIKVVYSDGHDKSIPMMQYEVLEEIVNESKERGMKVVAHIDRTEHVRDVIKAGVDGIEHFPLDFDPVQDREIIEDFIINEMFIVPTLSTYRSMMSDEQFSDLIENFTVWVESGVQVAAGTDAGNIPAGESLVEELNHYISSGMSSLEAIRSASIMSAMHLDMEDSLGSVSAGKKADLLVYNHNPLQRINGKILPEKPVVVMKSGQIIFKRI